MQLSDNTINQYGTKYRYLYKRAKKMLSLYEEIASSLVTQKGFLDKDYNVFTKQVPDRAPSSYCKESLFQQRGALLFCHLLCSSQAAS